VRVLAAQTLQYLSAGCRARYEGVHFGGQSALFVTVIKFAARLRGADAVLFMIGDMFTLLSRRGLTHWLIAMVLRKPIAFRGFAGGLAKNLRHRSLHHRGLARFVLSECSLVTFETKLDFRYFRRVLRRGRARIEWLPNTREAAGMRPPGRRRAERFCFIGRICKAKGVDLILEASEDLPEGISIDLYGPLDSQDAPGLGLDRLTDRSRATYQGIISPEEVPSVVREYDCLLLPTTWRTEGHPGVILEAFSVGMPVIATAWNGIPELVNESCGVLVEPGSGQSLRDAILNMHGDPAAWERMRTGAMERIAEFDPHEWSQRLESWVLDVAGAPEARSRRSAPAVEGSS
jgi:glycosyltransferase involved in cell wall biosynthesis